MTHWRSKQRFEMRWPASWRAIAILCAFVVPHAWAKEAVDWSQRWDIYKSYWDDPRPILTAARAALDDENPRIRPIAWLQIFCAYIMLDDDIRVVESENFQQAWDIAFKENIFENQVDLLILKAAYAESLTKDKKYLYAQNQGKSASELYEEAMAIARKHHLTRDYNRVIRNYVSYLFTSNQHHKALSLIEEGLAAALSDPDSDPFDKMLMQNKAATSFRFAEMYEKAEGILNDLAGSCDRLPYRSFCAVVYYELSGFHAFYSQKPDMEKALKVLEKALSLAEEVDDKWSVSAVHLQTARILLVQKKWEAAKAHALKANKGFRDMGYLNSAADALVYVAQAARNQGHLFEAIKVLKSALAELPEDHIRVHTSIRRELADIHEMQGEWKEAIVHRNKQLELDKKDRTDRDREQLSRQTVALGLQIEEERNKILQQENELQARRLHEAELEQRMRAQLAVAGIILFLATLLVLTWMIRKNREIQRLHLYIEKQVLQRFLPPKIITEILAGRSRFDEKPHARSVTILFADLVSFTAKAETLNPEQLSELLHEFFATMTEAIFAEGGTIDKFIGDAIMVVFGAPHDVEPRIQALQATRCGLSMRRALEALNADWEQRFGVAFTIRIGIHQGLGVVGSYGSEKRSDFTVIGRTVNLASRIESSAAPNQILVSKAIVDHLDPACYVPVRAFQLKGIEQPVMLYEIVTDSLLSECFDQAS